MSDGFDPKPILRLPRGPGPGPAPAGRTTPLVLHDPVRPGLFGARRAIGETAARPQGAARPAPDPVPDIAPSPVSEAAPGPAPVPPPARPAAARPGPIGSGPSALDLYVEHFGLNRRPFSLLPDPGFLFWSPAHMRAYAILEYGILTRAPITLITGEVGAGKTTLVHHLLANLGGNIRVGLISNAHGSRGELLRWVLMALDQPAPAAATYVDLFAAFQRYLIEEYAGGNRVILIFDEAQNLGRETLEELRMFTNINANQDELLQLVLVGQPELRDTIRRPDMRQFAQRVAASFHLPEMDLPTLRGYVTHRVQVAGGATGLFSAPALRLIHAVTGGVPRLVNQLCDLSLVDAFSRQRKTVSRVTVQRVLDDGVFFGPEIGAGPVAASPTDDDEDDDE